MRGSRFDRRQFLQRGSLWAAGLACGGVISGSGWLPALAQPLKEARQRRQCILLWMSGGPSQLDTFDLKPGQPTGGEFRETATSVPGIRISEHLPKLAQLAEHLAIVRSVSTREGDHERGTYLMRTGQRPGTPIAFPAIGSSVAKELTDDERTLPDYFCILPTSQVSPAAFSSGFLGPKYAAATVTATGDSPTAPSTDGDGTAPLAQLRIDDLTRPKHLPEDQLQRRIQLWDDLQRDFLADRSSAASIAQDTTYRRAMRMMQSADLAALDLSQESLAARERYGRGRFGQGCLMARRLIERGVPVVEVCLGDGLGWDTHQNNFQMVKQLSAALDQGWSTLMLDLQERGLLETTTILWMGEFGRTPTINAQGGRDHFPDAWSCVFAGGGIRGGQVWGRTSDDGSEVVEGKVHQGDILATLCAALKIDPAKENLSPEGRPHKIADGLPIGGLVKNV